MIKSSEVAKELGISDVAVGKLCARLQVPKPPRGVLRQGAVESNSATSPDRGFSRGG
ncbi:hypothetical protein J2X72_002629 [Phyllobacterium sp. 1468]|nr:hypothetical protein [Phyllobacterium sp. 1468]